MERWVVGWSAGLLAGWVAELLGLLGLLGLLEGVLGFLFLLEGGLNHVVHTLDALGTVGGFSEAPYINPYRFAFVIQENDFTKAEHLQVS